MDSTRSFKFLGYQLRVATEADFALAAQWTEADPEHKGKISPEFWIQDKPMKDDPGVERWILTDPHGAVFFFRIEKAVRIYIQFGPNQTAPERERNRNAMQAGLQWLTVMLGMRGVREVLFDSKVDALRAFCMRRLGFKPKKENLAKRIPIHTPVASTTEKAPQGVTA